MKNNDDPVGQNNLDTALCIFMIIFYSPACVEMYIKTAKYHLPEKR